MLRVLCRRATSIFAAATLIGAAGVLAAFEPPAEPGGASAAAKQPAGSPPERAAERTGERAGRAGAAGQQAPVTKQRLRARLEQARNVVRKLEEAQRLADANADPAEVEKAFAEAGRLGRFAVESERAGGNQEEKNKDEKNRRPSDKIFDLPGVPGLEEGGLGAGRAMSGEELATLKAEFERVAPRQFAKLREHSAGREQQMNRVMGIVAPRVRALGEAEKKDDGSAELRREELTNTLELIHHSRQMMELGKNATPEQREAAGKRLRETLGKQFDVRLRLQAKQIDQLFERATKMRADLNRLAEQRDKFVGEKATSILRGGNRATNGPAPKKPE